MAFGFEELNVYQKAIDFVNRIYSATQNYPKDEVFGLATQLRRAAVSISLNIAEGSARSKKDFSRFLDMARGSLFECVTILKISVKQNYMTSRQFELLESELVDLSKMLSGLKRSLS
jgi:four helix bundle protein